MYYKHLQVVYSAEGEISHYIALNILTFVTVIACVLGLHYCCSKDRDNNKNYKLVSLSQVISPELKKDEPV